ncbi:MAG: CHAD domain-containing protein, partial [Methanoregula sp.]|nr:CHAD domain-containing protein [Methanoregula sp.]
MMQAAERVDPPARPGAGFVFGAERMLALLDAFDREIPGVREGKDPEHLHRMRVASRRLRAALPLVLVGNKGDEHRAWVRQIKKITRALGAARDADVQIAFLKKYRKSLVPVVPALPVVSSLPTQPAAPDTPTLPGTTGDPGEPPAPTEDPVNALLTRLQKRRDPLQKEVFAALADLEK